ncbi:type 11 methyltransferase [Thermosulfidibacter takaii ABI70S6]|uniref:Type 11 methyltransferase n=1 Tax=Thermosulfidibacter takaii (strain DSM 17441 / JCM 13301 / NBRC 103674 / ABI70S6) TaxID=1298851 RepID=A0A0S3QUK3_THET7|nr:class I SAM-dependent methyltransferase [Thermosulfidibacter takaii]BAT72006.1 type 11 methyltransferase [Thermosulfidibacter takaii ABI70S6]
MSVWQPFNEYADKYDRWFDEYALAFQSELEAFKKAFPQNVTPPYLEIGVGTGRFAERLGIGYGADPAIEALKLAKKRGIKVVAALGERLPFKDKSFSLVLLNTVLCFVKEPLLLFQEIKRVIKEQGFLMVGMIDKSSFLGRYYVRKGGTFFRHAHFKEVDEVILLGQRVGFHLEEACQTLFCYPCELNQEEEVKSGWGEGGFVVLRFKSLS